MQASSDPLQRVVMIVLMVAMMTGAAPLPVVQATADPTVTTINALPSARAYTSAIWDGHAAYVFGGSDGASFYDEIVRYDPAADTVHVMSAKLPSARAYTSAIWDGRNAYIFGGYDKALDADLDDVVQYNTSTDTVTLLSTHLPSRGILMAAAWDGHDAYLLGGTCYHGCPRADIVRFSPATGSVSTMHGQLPTPRHSAPALWDGHYVDFLGGYDGTTELAQIVRYDPASDTIATSGATLPSPRCCNDAVWTGQFAYVFGGRTPGFGNVADVLRYNPLDGSTSVVASLPSARHWASAVWEDPCGAYVFGGYDGTTYFDGIAQYATVTPVPPNAPQGLVASAGPKFQQVQLSWQLPVGPACPGLTGFQVHRNDGSGWSTLATVAATALSYADTGLALRGVYQYDVTALNREGEGPVSNVACARPFPVGAALTC